MSRSFLLIATLALAVTAGCAPKAPVVTAPAAPRFPEYIFPSPGDSAAAAVAAQHDTAWRQLQGGDLRAAERSFAAVLKRAPDFYPSHAGLGYVALARKDHEAALAHFERALAANQAYAPALAGRGQTYLAMAQPAQALASFDAAVAADPSLSTIRSAADVLRFQVLQGGVAAARQAAEGGKLAEARTAYLAAIAATPDSPFLYRELSEVERRDGRLEDARQHAQKAVELEPGDARNHVALADVLEAQEQIVPAADALAAALAIEPNDALARREEALRERAARAALPDEFRAIATAPAITRAQLAALLGIELEALVTRAPGRGAVIMNDIRGNWARPWIVAVTRAGFMDAFANHAFQPNAVVRRGDFAVAVSRVLSVIAPSRPKDAAAWRNARPKFADLSQGNLNYPPAALAIAAGVMSADGGSFHQARPLTGAEAVAAVKKLEELAGVRRR